MTTNKAGEQPTITQSDFEIVVGIRRNKTNVSTSELLRLINGGAVISSIRQLPRTSLAAQDGLVKHMANRFLGWKLPENFSPDAGISFKPTFNDHLDPPMRNNPIGTNLFNATQAEEMVRYMLEGFHQ